MKALGQKMEAAEAELAGLEAEYEKLLETTRQEEPELASLVSVTTVPLAQSQQILKEDEAATQVIIGELGLDPLKLEAFKPRKVKNTKKIVTEHHGQIGVKSQADEGTVFTIALPAMQPAKKPVDSSETVIPIK